MTAAGEAEWLRAADAPVFAEPWQAEAFAMTVALHESGLFSWANGREALSAEVKSRTLHRTAAITTTTGCRTGKAACSQGRRSRRRRSTPWPRHGSAPRTQRRTASRSCWKTIRSIAEQSGRR